MTTAYFAGGCFWCIAPVMKIRPGVTAVVSGYSGGDEENPSYEDVKAQKTGHRETIRVDFDERLTSYDELFDVYLAGVDPFDGGGQFIDRGRSYTLAVYFTSDEQKKIAEEKIRDLEKGSGEEVFIFLEPFKSFWPAEERHQDYYLKNPEEFERELELSGRKERLSGANQ